MKFTPILATLALVAAPALGESLAYDPLYDKASGSLTTVACSDGEHGLITRGFKKFGDLPTFPRIGAAGVIEDWNSPNCGTCWELTWKDGQGKLHTEIMTAIDATDPGEFVTSLSALNTLTNGQGTNLGRVNVTAKKLDASKCGL